MKEIFIDIKDYEGKYQVSNFGNVRNNAGKILAQRKNKDGYMLITLYNKNGERKTHGVHRLVLSSFKANPDNKPCVNHLDENPSNNALDNLEWCTYAENNTHNGRHLRVAEKNKKKVYCVELNKIFDSATDAALWLGKEKSGKSMITKCCKNKYKSAYNYHWWYAEDLDKK